MNDETLRHGLPQPSAIALRWNDFCPAIRLYWPRFWPRPRPGGAAKSFRQRVWRGSPLRRTATV